MGKKLTIIEILFENVVELRSRYYELRDWVAVWSGSNRETEVWLRFKLVETIFNVRAKVILT